MKIIKHMVEYCLLPTLRIFGRDFYFLKLNLCKYCIEHTAIIVKHFFNVLYNIYIYFIIKLFNVFKFNVFLLIQCFNFHHNSNNTFYNNVITWLQYLESEIRFKHENRTEIFKT